MIWLIPSLLFSPVPVCPIVCTSQLFTSLLSSQSPPPQIQPSEADCSPFPELIRVMAANRETRCRWMEMLNYCASNKHPLSHFWLSHLRRAKLLRWMAVRGSSNLFPGELRNMLKVNCDGGELMVGHKLRVFSINEIFQLATWKENTFIFFDSMSKQLMVIIQCLYYGMHMDMLMFKLPNDLDCLCSLHFACFPTLSLKWIFVWESGEVSQAADQLVFLATCHSGRGNSGTKAASLIQICLNWLRSWTKQRRQQYTGHEWQNWSVTLLLKSNLIKQKLITHRMQCFRKKQNRF